MINIPGYRIERELGRGGMATVYLAEQIGLSRMVALKVMTPELDKDTSFTARFLKEGATVAKLVHPNIIKVFDAGVHEGIYYLTMEYFAGGTLSDLIRRGITPTESLGILRAMASALRYAHEQGLIHRDIKPQNILLYEDGTPVLADFGIAKLLSSSSTLTAAGFTPGTPRYMSPEQILGKVLDERTDIYALGVVFYQMLTGNVPYHADNTFALAYKHLHDPIPHLPEHLAMYQPLLDAMLAKDLDDRLPNAQTLLDRLNSLGVTSSGMQFTAKSVPGRSDASSYGDTVVPGKSKAARTRKSRLLIGTVAVLVLGGLGFGGIYLIRIPPDSPPVPVAQQEAERLAREQAEREEAARLARERAEREEAERLAREQAEREEAERLAREQAEREEAARLARERAEREEAERLAREQAEREEAERLAREQAEREEAARLAREQAEREEAERLAREQAEREEAERLAREQAEREEAERLAREQAEREEAERLAREQAEREEAARLARERAEREEAERLAREQAEREEAERLAREQAEREEAARLARERAEREEAERLARERAEREAAIRLENALALDAAQRRAIQQALTRIGFSTRGVDGVFGPNTRTAIAAYQTARGFPVTRYLTGEQVEQLLREAPPPVVQEPPRPVEPPPRVPEPVTPPVRETRPERPAPEIEPPAVPPPVVVDDPQLQARRAALNEELERLRRQLGFVEFQLQTYTQPGYRAEQREWNQQRRELQEAIARVEQQLQGLR